MINDHGSTSDSGTYEVNLHCLMKDGNKGVFVFVFFQKEVKTNNVSTFIKTSLTLIFSSQILTVDLHMDIWDMYSQKHIM